MDQRERILRRALLDAAGVFRACGFESEARKLEATPVKVGAKLACVWRVIRVVEQSVQVQWGLNRLGPSLPGKAVEALALVRCAAASALAETPGWEAWLESLSSRTREILRQVGGQPRGRIEEPDE